MRRLARAVLDLISSMRLSVVLLLLLLLLTYLGTLYQVEHGLYLAQKTYFDSWWLSQPLGESLAVPLPGGLLVMTVLFVNLVVGGLIRMKFTKRRLGVIITHVGILYLLFAGFVKFAYSDEGALQLFEGQQGDEYRSYYEWEVVIGEPLGGGRTREYLIPQEQLGARERGHGARFEHERLPFSVEFSGYVPNSRPLPKGPMFEVEVPIVDGFFLQEQERVVEAERNVPGCYATLRDDDGAIFAEGILWGGSAAPLVVELDGAAWSFDMRKQRMTLPFSVKLDETARELYPGTSKPRSFMSDVTFTAGEQSQEIRIQMNEPLRHAGFVLYQSGWGPDNARPGDRLFSVFAVVRNPADRWPLYACIVISIGLLLQFSQSLLAHIRRELRPSP